MFILNSVNIRILLWRSDVPLFERMTSAIVSVIVKARKIDMMIIGFFISNLLT